MERLTRRDKNGNLECKPQRNCGHYCGSCMIHIKKLAQYEDTGLSPEQIKQMQDDVDDGVLVRVVRCRDCKYAAYEQSESNSNTKTCFCEFYIQGRLQTSYCNQGVQKSLESEASQN